MERGNQDFIENQRHQQQVREGGSERGRDVRGARMERGRKGGGSGKKGHCAGLFLNYVMCAYLQSVLLVFIKCGPISVY